MRRALLVALLGLVAALTVPPGAAATTVPAPLPCSGDFSTFDDGRTPPTAELIVRLQCGSQRSAFYGLASSPALNACPGGGTAAAHFEGNDNRYGGQRLLGSWDLAVRNGIATLSGRDVDGRSWRGIGALPATVGETCSAYSSIGFTAVQTGSGGQAPQPLLCHVTGTRGSTFNAGGRDIVGDGSGGGTCTSATGTWQVHYSGDWHYGPTPAGACPGVLWAILTVVDPAGHAISYEQTWTEDVEAGHRALEITETTPADVVEPLYVGAGTSAVSGNPCPIDGGRPDQATFALAVLP